MLKREGVTESGKSLFSINVQDDIIQSLFKEMKGEIESLKHKVSFLTDELATRPSVDDYKKLVLTTKELQEKNKENENQIKQFLSTTKNEINKLVEETKREVKEQMEDTTLSVNSVIRAHNVLIDKKVFEMTKPTFEFNEMKRSVASITENESFFQKQLKKLFDFISSFLSEPFPSDGKARMSLDQIFESKQSEDKDSIKIMNSQMTMLDNRMEKIETMFFRIADLSRMDLPLYESAPAVHFKDKPKIPKLKNPKTFTDYFKYLMEVVPATQKILSCYRKEIELIKSALGETTLEEIEEKRKKEEKQFLDFVKADEFDTVKKQIQDISNSVLMKDDFRVIQTDIKNLRETTVEKEEFDATCDKFNLSIKQVDQKASEGIKNLEMSLAETKMNINSMPAYTEVKGRPGTAFKILYSPNPDQQANMSYSPQMKTSSRSMKPGGKADKTLLLPNIRPPTANSWGVNKK